MDINPIELVRQLTLADFECLSKITPRELSHQSWNKTDARVRAPHIINMIERFNRVQPFKQYTFQDLILFFFQID